MVHRYFIMLYQALINLGVSEMAPVNEIEFITITLSSIISAIFFSIVFGQIVTISQLLSDKDRQT